MKQQLRLRMRLLKASMSMFFLLMAEVSLCHTTSIVSYPGINRGNLFSYSARLSCSRVYPISGNTQSVSAIAGSLSHIVYGLQDPHSSWPTSFGSIIINSPLCQESHCRSNVSMQTSVSVHPRTDCPWTYPESYLAGPRRTGKLIQFSRCLSGYPILKFLSVAFSASKYKKVRKSLGRFEKNF